MNIDLIIKRLRLAITTFHGIVCHTNGAWGSNWKGEGMNALYAYFAYGSNLMPDRLLQRCPTAVPYAPAILPNYRLTERLYADVDFTPRAKVHGFVYRYCLRHCVVKTYLTYRQPQYRQIDLGHPPRFP